MLPLTFDQAVTVQRLVTPQAVVEQMTANVLAGTPFCHLRFNDGEALCAFEKRRPEEKNGCGHNYFADLAHDLREMMVEVKKRPVGVMLGSYWHTQGHRIDQLDEAATALMEWVGATDADASELVKWPWVGSDDVVEGLVGGYTLKLFDAIREASKQRPVYLVGNSKIIEGRRCLNAAFFMIDRYNCWSNSAKVEAWVDFEISRWRGSKPIIVWCCGLAKPWIWDAWTKFPQTTHIDAGHLFDAACGEPSRAYSRRRNREEPKWLAYEDLFVPYMRGFIK